MNYYINYYSKLRTTFTTTEEELVKEILYNAGRVVTKVLEYKSQLKHKEVFTKASKKIVEICLKFYREHCNDIEKVAFIDEVRWGNIYYHDFNKLYKTFNIPKASGGYRTICAPEDSLKELQQAIIKIITKELKFLPHNAAHGFTKNRNCKTALIEHSKHHARWFLKIDIKDFFPNTTYDNLYTALNHVYPFACLSELAKWWIVNVCTANGALPQGAPTSPVLTNIVMVACDVAITQYCKSKGLTYTRYADDILISGDKHFDWQTVQTDIQKILYETHQYEIKPEKTRYGNLNGRNWNLGLMYNKDSKITVGHAKKQLVKNWVHNYLTKPECHTQEEYHRLMGIIGYCKFIEPEYFERYLDAVKAAPPA